MSAARDSLATIAALAVHAAAFAVAWPLASRSPSFSLDPSATSGRAEIEIDLRDEPTPPTPKPPEPPRSSPQGVNGDGRERAFRPDLPPLPSPSMEPSRAGAPARAASSGEVAPANAAPPSEYGATPALPILGNGSPFGAPAWTIAGVLPSGPDMPQGSSSATPGRVGPRATEVPAAVRARADASLRDPITAHDRSLGLGNPGGTAISNAVADAVSGSSLPGEATGTFLVQVSGDGSVVGVRVQRFDNGDSKAWSNVAASAAASLGKKKIGLAGLGPKGAVVKVEVRSSVTYPSGSRERARSNLPGLFDGPPRDVMPAPSPDGGDACTASSQDGNPLCGVGMVVARGDLTDLFTKKHRNVRASFQVQLLDTPSRDSPPPATPPTPPTQAPSATPHQERRH